MKKQAREIADLPPAVVHFLDAKRDLLRMGKIERLRFYPLILQAPLETLTARRGRLFDLVRYDRAAHGVEVAFRRRLKRSQKHPDGRDCAGTFQLLRLSDELLVVLSELKSDDHSSGPLRFTEKAYPLARRPFFSSSTLVRQIERFATDHAFTVTASDTWGYDRESRRPRRDMKLQPPASAAREMGEQGRYVHRMMVSFRRRKHEVLRLRYDRNAALTVLKGDPSWALKELVLPSISEAATHDATFAVSRTAELTSQEAVELSFADDPFISLHAMRSLCTAIQHADGLNVAIVHLNPYLQAQILDFFSGAAIEMIITDARSLSLVPRSAECTSAIQRVATTIFRHFGEGQARRTPLGTGK